LHRPGTRGRGDRKKNFTPLEKYIGHSLKNLGLSENSSPLLASQAGYGPDFALVACFACCSLGDSG